MRLYIAAVLGPLALGLAACDPRAADSPGATPPSADTPAKAPVQHPAPTMFDGDFKLVGTEPFWGLDIKDAQLVLNRPDEPDIVAPRPAPVLDGRTAVWRSGILTARLTPGDCSDGMSERDHAYAATVQVGAVILEGCGDRPEALAAPRP